MEKDSSAESAHSKEQGGREDSATEQKVVVSNSSQLLVEETEVATRGDFHNNDNKILSLLNEAGSNYSFKGLMRKLNLHQQSLSRALRRLGELGLVENSELGYRLNRTGTSTASGLHRPKGKEYTQLLQTYIPLNVKPGELVKKLAGKWFKSLRWIGMVDGTSGYTLQWTSEDGSFEINLRLISDYVIVETNASAEKEKIAAMAASYAIYQQIVKVMQNKIGNAYLFGHGNLNN